jgi:hypothetical protein
MSAVGHEQAHANAATPPYSISAALIAISDGADSY